MDNRAGNSKPNNETDGVLSAQRSAEAYGEIARTEIQMASEATKAAHFGTAETHRKNAAMAFDCEMKLRLSHGEQSTTVKASNQK